MLPTPPPREAWVLPHRPPTVPLPRGLLCGRMMANSRARRAWSCEASGRGVQPDVKCPGTHGGLRGREERARRPRRSKPRFPARLSAGDKRQHGNDTGWHRAVTELHGAGRRAPPKRPPKDSRRLVRVRSRLPQMRKGTTQRLPAELNSLRVKNGPSSRDDVLQLFFHETLMIRGGWNFSDSWPAKLRAGDSASRVHLTCNSRGAP